MKVIITCGPSYEPIDQARRLTNFSTGRLGISLSNSFTAAGHEVLCLKGEGSTCCDTLHASRVVSFATNDDLANELERLKKDREITAILHAAALCDYKVHEIRNNFGVLVDSPKIPTSNGSLQLNLVPATKVLPKLREWFPTSKIVGWKYELAGSREDAFTKAWTQIEQARTDACVLNGAAYGEGFAVCHSGRKVDPCTDAVHLGAFLMEWLIRPAQ